MLKTNTRKKGEVYTIKLTTGEEMMAKYKDSDEDHFYVEKPLVLAIQPTEDGNQALGLAPYAATLDPKDSTVIPININTIVTYFEPPVEMARAYLQQTSGIQLV